MTINNNNYDKFSFTEFDLPAASGSLLTVADMTQTLINNISLGIEDFSFAETASIRFQESGLAFVEFTIDEDSGCGLLGLPLSTVDDLVALIAALINLGATVSTLVDKNGNVYESGDSKFEFAKYYAQLTLKLYFGYSYNGELIYPLVPAAYSDIIMSETVNELDLSNYFANLDSISSDCEFISISGTTITLGSTLPEEETGFDVTLTNETMSYDVGMKFIIA